MIIRIIFLACLSLIFSSNVLGQTCETRYRTCVRGCNETRDQALARNNLERSQVRIRLGQALTQCNVQFVTDPVGRQECRRAAQAAAAADFARLDGLDRQAQRERINCISECRRQLRECQTPAPTPNFGGNFEIECLEGGPPCRGEVSEFCQRAVGACDDCWRSLCGGGEWQIDSDVPLRSVTLVAVRNNQRQARILATSSSRGGRLKLNVPRNIKLNTGEQLYFQFSPSAPPGRPMKITVTSGRP